MAAFKSTLDPRSETFRANTKAMKGLADELKKRLAAIAKGGGEEARKKHLARGKLLPRERIRLLLDPGAPFLEIGQLAAHGMYNSEVPAADSCA